MIFSLMKIAHAQKLNMISHKNYLVRLWNQQQHQASINLEEAKIFRRTNRLQVAPIK